MSIHIPKTHRKVFHANVPGAPVKTATNPPAVQRASSPVLPVCGLAATGVGAALLVLLHLLPQTDGISTVDDTISEYAFTSVKWLFSLSVVLVATGTGCVFAALMVTRAVRAVSVTSVAASLWTVGMLLIVVFEKTDWAVGPSISGTIHRYASVVAFLALPLAVLAAARTLPALSRGWRLAARALALVSWLGFGVILVAVVRTAAGGPAWWQALPLGLVERGIAGSAVLAVAAIAAGLAGHSRT